MSNYVYALIAALVITSLGGYFIKQSLKSARTEGITIGRLECSTNQNNATADVLSEREGIANDEFQIDDFDDALYRLGIVRDENDR